MMAINLDRLKLMLSAEPAKAFKFYKENRRDFLEKCDLEAALLKGVREVGISPQQQDLSSRILGHWVDLGVDNPYVKRLSQPI